MPVSDPPRKRKPQKKSKKTKTTIQGDLNLLDGHCKELLSKAASLYPYLRQRELITAGDHEAIANAASILVRDVETCNEQLNKIRSQWVDNFDLDNPDHVALGLSIGGQYEEWIDNFLGSVTPNVDHLSTLIVTASENLNEKQKSSTSETEASEGDVTDE